MNFNKRSKIEKSLNLTNEQVNRLRSAINKAYQNEFTNLDINSDRIFEFLAPHINTQEEAFYVAINVSIDLFSAIYGIDVKTLK